MSFMAKATIVIVTVELAAVVAMAVLADVEHAAFLAAGFVIGWWLDRKLHPR